MKKKLVLWGTNAQDERVLLALELHPESSSASIYEFPEAIAADAFAKSLMDEWRNGKEVTFPEGHQTHTRDVAVADSLLPEHLKVERTDVVNRAQTEWQFVILSAKLKHSYESELQALRDRIDKLEKYDSGVWEELKKFWDKVQTQVNERSLFREHADTLRTNTNALFSQMKSLRSKMDQEFKSLSKSNVEKFINQLDELEKQIIEGSRLKSVFEDLKGLQRSFRDTKFTRDDRSKVWKKLDKAFKDVKEKRFGPEAGRETSATDRISKRLNGLVNAIERMERSIKRDKDELEFQNRRIAKTDGQLEAQIRQAKIKMVQERVNSKSEKLQEMVQTRVELERKVEQAKSREAEREAQRLKAEAEKEAAEKIKEKIEQEAQAREAQSEELEQAAAQITGEQEPDEGMSLSETVTETVEDAVDTVKAIASVVTDKINEAVEGLQTDTSADAESETEPSMDKPNLPIEHPAETPVAVAAVDSPEPVVENDTDGLAETVPTPEALVDVVDSTAAQTPISTEVPNDPPAVEMVSPEAAEVVADVAETVDGSVAEQEIEKSPDDTSDLPPESVTAEAPVAADNEEKDV